MPRVTLTRAQNPFVPGAGEVITLAEGPVDLAELGLVAPALVTATLPSSTTHLPIFGFSTGAEIQAAHISLLALTVSAAKSGLTLAPATGVSARGATAAAFGLSGSRTLTSTLVIHRHLQTVFKTNRLNGEALLGPRRRAAMGRHTYVKGDLKNNTNSLF